MTPDLDRIRTTHAAAIANRQRGSFDSRDDDIGALLGEVDRLTAEVKWVTELCDQTNRLAMNAIATWEKDVKGDA